ncbi:MAG: hypothetical protein WCS79_07515 [Paludibacter sp.]
MRTGGVPVYTGKRDCPRNYREEEEENGNADKHNNKADNLMNFGFKLMKKQKIREVILSPKREILKKNYQHNE